VCTHVVREALRAALLNFIVLMGYPIVHAVAVGQILAAVSGSKDTSVAVAIIISICLAGIVSIFGTWLSPRN
jgi:purine-cytosine permease-like protein